IASSMLYIYTLSLHDALPISIRELTFVNCGGAATFILLAAALCGQPFCLRRYLAAWIATWLQAWQSRHWRSGGKCAKRNGNRKSWPDSRRAAVGCPGQTAGAGIAWLAG